MKKLSFTLLLLAITTTGVFATTGGDIKIIRKVNKTMTIIKEIDVQQQQVITKTIINGQNFRSVVVRIQPMPAKSSETINSCTLIEEMDRMQESMSQMDASLINEDNKNRKTAQEVLRNGFASN